jgi:hypothetical protein
VNQWPFILALGEDFRSQQSEGSPTTPVVPGVAAREVWTRFFFGERGSSWTGQGQTADAEGSISGIGGASATSQSQTAEASGTITGDVYRSIAGLLPSPLTALGEAFHDVQPEGSPSAPVVPGVAAREVWTRTFFGELGSSATGQGQTAESTGAISGIYGTGATGQGGQTADASGTVSGIYGTGATGQGSQTAAGAGVVIAPPDDAYVLLGGNYDVSWTDDKSHHLLDEDENVLWSGKHAGTVFAVATIGEHFYIAGARVSSVTTRKYDIDGNEITADDWPLDHGDTVYAITADRAGNVYTGGARTGNLTTRKYNSAGVLQWSADHGDTVYAIAVDDDGNVYTGGEPVSNVKIRKYDSAGTKDDDWDVEWGTEEEILGLAIDSTSLYASKGRGSGFGGDTETVSKWALNDASKTWGKSIEDLMSGVTVDGSGNVYICGRQYLGSNHLFKLNSSGTIVWSKQPGGFAAIGLCVDVDPIGNIYAGVENSLYKYNAGGTEIWDFGHGWTVRAVAVGGKAIVTAVPALAFSLAMGMPWNTVYDVVPGLALPLALAVPSILLPPVPDFSDPSAYLSALATLDPTWAPYATLAANSPAGAAALITPTYAGTVTGPGELLSLPLSAIECRREQGQSTWMTVRATYTPSLYTALSARMGAELVVFAGVRVANLESSGIFLRAVLTDVTYTYSPQGGELRLTGRVQTPSYSPTTRALIGVQSLQTVEGRRTVRCDIDPLLRPNDTATWDGESWTVAIIQYEITPQDAWMRVTETL